MAYKNLEDNLAQQKRWREDAILEGRCTRCKNSVKEGYKLCEYHIQYAKESNKKQPREKKNKKSRERYANLKNEVYSYYGTKCLCCGESNRDFLTIDHIEGNGAEHRKTLSKSSNAILLWLKQNNYPEGFRILCFNCNIAMGLYGECPHKNLPPQKTGHPSNPFNIKTNNTDKNV